MATINDVINKHKFTSLVWNYTGITGDVLKKVNYVLETRDVDELDLGKLDMGIQVVRMRPAPPTQNRTLDLKQTAFFTIFRPGVEDDLDNDDIYAKRDFPNYFFLVEEDPATKKCFVREMTGAGPQHGMEKLPLKDMDAVWGLIVKLAHEAHTLDQEVSAAQERIRVAEGDRATAYHDYDQRKRKLFATARTADLYERD